MDLTRFPTSTKREVGGVVLQLLASCLPVGSGAAGVLLSALLPELSNDRIAWLEYLGASLLGHEERLEAHEGRLQALDLDEMVQRPEFRAAVLRTTDIALRDPLRKKWEILCNAIHDIASGLEPDDNLQSIFLGYIEDLTVMHLLFLDCIAGPLAWAKRRNYPVHVGPQEVDARAVFEGECRTMLQPPGLHAVLLQDLYSRGLAANEVNPDSFLSPPPELHRPHITDLGRLFLAFIGSPDSPDKARNVRETSDPTEG